MIFKAYELIQLIKILQRLRINSTSFGAFNHGFVIALAQAKIWLMPN